MKKHLLIVYISLIFIMISTPLNAASSGGDHGGSGSSEKSEDDNQYLDFKPIFIPVVTNKQVTQHVSLLISLDIEEGDIDEIKKYMPRLSNAYIEDLYGALGDGEAMMYDDFVDVEKVRSRLILVTNKTLGKTPAEEYKIRDVLIKVVQQNGL